MWLMYVGHMGDHTTQVNQLDDLVLGNSYRLWGRSTFLLWNWYYKNDVSLNLSQLIFPTICGETAEIKETHIQWEFRDRNEQQIANSRVQTPDSRAEMRNNL